MIADPFAKNLVDQRFIRERVVSAEQALSDLHVDQCTGGPTAFSQAETNFLAAAVCNNGYVRIGENVPPGRNVAHFQRVDRDLLVFRRELKQAKLWGVPRFGHEFGVKRDQSNVANVGAKLLERPLVGD